MNHIYKTCYNRALGTWVAVPETARVHGNASTRSGGAPRFIRHTLAAALFAAAVPGLAADINNGTGSNSITINPAANPATAAGNNAIAAGTSAQANGNNAFAAGTNAVAGQRNSIAIGNQAEAPRSNNPMMQSHNSSIAIGDAAKARGDLALAIGPGAEVEGGDSAGGIAIGSAATSKNGGMSVGSGANAGNGTALIPGMPVRLNNNVALGDSANVKDDTNFRVALGSFSIAGEQDLTAAPYKPAPNATVAGVADAGVMLGEVSVGGDNTAGLGQKLYRRVTNVAAGAADTDAVNVSQLKAAQTHYYSVNDNGTQVSNYNNDGATGNNALAAGTNASAGTNRSVAIGNRAKATTDTSNPKVGPNPGNHSGLIAVGDNAQALNDKAVAIGQDSETMGYHAVAVGVKAHAEDNSAVAVGNSATALATNGVAMGRSAQSDASNGTTIGSYSKIDSTAESSTALGTRAYSGNNHSVSVGSSSSSRGQRAVAVGSYSYAEGAASSAIGYQAITTNDNGQGANRGSGSSSTAIGTGTVVSGNQSGGWSAAGNENPQSYGNGNRSYIGGSGNYAIGNRNIVGTKTSNSVAFGNNIRLGATGAQLVTEKPTGDSNQSIAARRERVNYSGEKNLADAVAIGNAAGVADNGGTAVGAQAQTAGENASAFGRNAKAGHANAVALGSNAETAAAVGTNDATVNGIKYQGFAGSSPVATVSVGKAGAERTITNVAAGRINAASTDAINGSQLYLTQQALGNVGKTTVNTLGGNAKMDEDGNISMSNIGNTGENTVHDAIKKANDTANAGWNVRVNGGGSENIKPGDTLTFKDGNNIAITNNGKAITIATKPDLTADSLSINNGPVINGNGINMGNKKITNLAAGTANGDAVNIGQLNQAVTNINNNINAAKTHYYSVNDGGTQRSNYNNDGATGNNALAAGTNAAAAGAEAVAVGSDSNAAVADSVAIGRGAKTTGTGSGATAIGRNANANGQGATAIGINARSDGQSIAIGTNANNRFGTAGTIGTSSVAIGNNTSAAGINTVATGNEAIATREQATAVGFNTKAYGKSSVALGDSAVSGVENDAEVAQTIAVGVSSQATGHGSTALGSRSQSTALYGTSLGISSKNSVDFGVALGALSNTDGLTVGNAGYVMPSASAADKAAVAATRSNVAGVSVGGKAESAPFMPNGVSAGQEIRRQIHYVAAGTADTDAVNVAQLKAAQTHYYSVNDNGTQVSNYNNDGATGNNALAAGTNAAAAGAAAVAVGNGATASGQNATASGSGAQANAANATASGSGAQANAANATASGSGAQANAANATANGSGAQANAANATASGSGAQASAENAAALGSNASASESGGVALGAESTADRAASDGSTAYVMPGADAADAAAISATAKGDLGAVSVGNGSNTRQIINVAAGSEDSDAVNVAQLKAVANKARGTTVNNTYVTQVVNNTTVSAGKNIQVRKNGDNYRVELAENISVNNIEANDIRAGSVTTGDARMDTNGFAIAGNTLDKGGLTVNGDTYISADGINANNRTIRNIAPGRVAANSTDAVNGAQLYALGQRMDGMGKRIDSARGGVASAIATAGLPQAYRPGASMVAAAGGYYDGQSAVAIGLSTISDNGRWILKGAANVNSKEAGASIGVGYQW